MSPHLVFIEILVASPSYLKLVGPINSFDDLLKASLVDMSSQFNSLRPWFTKNAKSFLKTLSRRTPAIIIENHVGMRDIVRAGFGVAVLPTHLIQEDLKLRNVVQLFRDSKPVRVGIDLAVRKKRTKRLIESLLIDHLLA